MYRFLLCIAYFVVDYILCAMFKDTGKLDLESMSFQPHKNILFITGSCIKFKTYNQQGADHVILWQNF